MLRQTHFNHGILFQKLFLQLNQYETAPYFLQLGENFTLDNFMITSCKNLEIQGNSGKSTNNPMSSFRLIEENMELSHTD